MKTLETTRFTLVELLIVVAIISILAALILPALSSARGTVKRITCAANMRQIGQGCFMYVNDYNGWMPPVSNTTTHLLHIRDYIKANPEATGGYTTTTALMFKRPAGLCFCPSLSNPPQSSPCWWDGANSSAYYLPCYMYTTSLSTDPKSGGWKINGWTRVTANDVNRRLDLIENESAILADMNFSSATYGYEPDMCYAAKTSTGSLTASQAPGWMHPGKTSNFLFKDGHVSSHKAGTQFDGSWKVK
jgi:prepilin-type N-terminal cleavage/methylation domain-containing protein/prepilin-type processing-associated H-X9-DG protein